SMPSIFHNTYDTSRNKRPVQNPKSHSVKSQKKKPSITKTLESYYVLESLVENDNKAQQTLADAYFEVLKNLIPELTKPEEPESQQESAEINLEENKVKDCGIGTEKEEIMKQHKSDDMDFDDDKYKLHRKETGLGCRYENETREKAHEVKEFRVPITRNKEETKGPTRVELAESKASNVGCYQYGIEGVSELLRQIDNKSSKNGNEKVVTEKEEITISQQKLADMNLDKGTNERGEVILTRESSPEEESQPERGVKNEESTPYPTIYYAPSRKVTHKKEKPQ
ncbi:21844_t:CDS:2, partial [Gigaspora rosea]